MPNEPRDFVHIEPYVLTRDGRIRPILRERLNTGIRVYDNGRGARHILVSARHGGPNSDDFDLFEKQGISEAQRCLEYLVSNGVPEGVIVKEEDSFSTVTVTRESYKVIQTRGWRSGFEVTTDVHLFRKFLNCLIVYDLALLDNIDFLGAKIPPDEAERQKFLWHELQSLSSYTLPSLIDFVNKNQNISDSFYSRLTEFMSSIHQTHQNP